MDDNGLDWEWTRTEFRKALLACTHAATDGDLSEAVELLYELRTCSLLILNFRHRLSSKQHKGLSDLAAVTDLEDINLDDEWDVPEGEDRFARLRFWLEKAIKQARESSSLFEGI
jgi:hypothetical protein